MPHLVRHYRQVSVEGEPGIMQETFIPGMESILVLLKKDRREARVSVEIVDLVGIFGR